MKYQIMVSVVVEANGDRHAHAQASALGDKLRKEVLGDPLTRMALAAAGISLVDDGRLVIYAPQPQREAM